MFLQAFAIATALSIDAFAASFAYGSKKIKIPMRSVQVINLICSGTAGLSLLTGSILQNYIPSRAAAWISFIILFALGMIKLLDSLTKAVIRKHSTLNKKVSFSLFNIRFILNLYADPEKADINDSKILEPAEAASLAIALSLDGIAVGFGAALVGISALAVFLISLVTGTLCIMLGAYTGRKLIDKTSRDLSWIGGMILIALALSKLL